MRRSSCLIFLRAKLAYQKKLRKQFQSMALYNLFGDRCQFSNKVGNRKNHRNNEKCMVASKWFWGIHVNHEDIDWFLIFLVPSSSTDYTLKPISRLFNFQNTTIFWIWINLNRRGFRYYFHKKSFELLAKKFLHSVIKH